jgi:hypothetical protein
MYRAAGTGRWAGVAIKDEPVPPPSVYAGGTFLQFGKRPTLASTTGCGGSNLVAFSALVYTYSTISGRPTVSWNDAVFLYDAASGTIHDVEPVGSYQGGDPVIVIDPNLCQAHVIYSDAGWQIRDAVFGIPGLTPGGITTLMQNGITPAPPPFPDGAVLRLPRTLSAAYGPGPGVVVAFHAPVEGPGSSYGKGIFSWATGGTLTTHARSRDPGCPPPWPDAGRLYTSFRPTPSAAALLGPAVAFVARSNGSWSRDTAIVLNQGGCGGTNVVQAAEDSSTPLGGRYGDLWVNKELAGAANGTTVFMAKIHDIAGTPTALIRSTGDVVARSGFADTALGAAVVRVFTPKAWAINSAGAVVFTARLSGFYDDRAVLYDTPAILPELVTLNGYAYQQIDELGNMVVGF